jgi:hypothetical protein
MRNLRLYIVRKSPKSDPLIINTNNLHAIYVGTVYDTSNILYTSRKNITIHICDQVLDNVCVDTGFIRLYFYKNKDTSNVLTFIEMQTHESYQHPYIYVNLTPKIT